MKRDRTYESICNNATQIVQKYAELTDFISNKQIGIRISKCEPRIKIDNPETQPTISREYKPLNEVILPKEPISEPIQLEKEIIPKQWKTKQIDEFIQENKENLYKSYCEQQNDMAMHPNWEQEWITFVASVKGKKDTTPIIKAFVENLRRIRHNQLCAKDIVEKEDREQWPAITVVRAFLENKLDKFKTYTELRMGEKPDNPKWIKRWAVFIASLEKNRDNRQELKNQCSKFMTAQRIKKYRQSK
jgi:hypothetical protein